MIRALAQDKLSFQFMTLDKQSPRVTADSGWPISVTRMCLFMQISSAANQSIGSTTGCTITEKAPTRAFSWLKAATTAFTFKTLLRHYAKWALTPWSLNLKLGSRRNHHKGWAAIRHYANQTARPL